MTGFVFEIVFQLIFFGVLSWQRSGLYGTSSKRLTQTRSKISSLSYLHCCGCSICDALLRRDGNPDVRSDDDCIGYLAGAVLAVVGIAVGGPSWSGYLYRPNGVAVVALAQTGNPSMRRGGATDP